MRVEGVVAHGGVALVAPRGSLRPRAGASCGPARRSEPSQPLEHRVARGDRLHAQLGSGSWRRRDSRYSGTRARPLAACAGASERRQDSGARSRLELLRASARAAACRRPAGDTRRRRRCRDSSSFVTRSSRPARRRWRRASSDQDPLRSLGAAILPQPGSGRGRSTLLSVGPV